MTDHVLRALAKAYRCSPGDLLDRPPPPQKSLHLALSRQIHDIAPAGEELGLGALHVALAALRRVALEVTSMRGDLTKRLGQLDAEIARVEGGITEALRDSVDLAETLQRTAGNITRALNRQPADGDGDDKPSDSEDADNQSSESDDVPRSRAPQS